MTSCASQLHRAIINTSPKHHFTEWISSLFRHTFVHTTFPLEQWQVLQSSSHLTPSRVIRPLTEHGFLVTVKRNRSIRNISQNLCLFCGICPFIHLVKTSTFLAVGAKPVWCTQAAISIDLIHTSGAEGTWRGLTLINICQGGRARGKKWLPFGIKYSQTAHKCWVKQSAHKSNS